MSEPTLTPRLEQIRALLAALRGDEVATLATLIQGVVDTNGWAEIDYAQQILHTADLGLIARSTGGEGLPAAGSPWANIYYGLLNQLISTIATATANQLEADDAAIVFLQRLAGLDNKAESILALLETQDENRLTLSGYQQGVSEITSLLATTNTLLQELIDCCNEGGSTGEPLFPTGLCPAFGIRLGVVGPKDVQGTPGSGEDVVYRYSIDTTNIGALTGVTFIQDPFFDFTWFSNDLPDDRQICIAMAPLARSTPGEWRVKWVTMNNGQLPSGIGGGNQIDLFQAANGDGQLVTLLEATTEPLVQKRWYSLELYQPFSVELPPNVPGVWFNFGALG